MLDDRKFFFDVTDRYAPWGTASDMNWGSGPFPILVASPWKAIGPAGTVSMSPVNPYTGRVVLAADPGVTVTVRVIGDGGAVTEIATAQPGAKEVLRATLPPLSWNVIRLKERGRK